MFDITKIRAEFPILKRIVNGNPLVYFDNASTTQKPKVVLNSLINYYENYNANIHRGVHTLSQEATDAFEKVRKQLHKHFNTAHSHEIIFTKGTTESINLVADGFSQILEKGDEVIISQLEHHSNIVPWQLACQKSGAKLKVIPINDKGELLLKEFEYLLSHKTKVIAINHVSNSLGTINPIREIIKKARSYDVAILIDGAQATPHFEVDVQDLDCDFYCTSAHKMYGPTGVGMLYGKEKWLNKLPPYQGGGEMISDVSFEKTTYADLPYKFEAGTPNMADVIGFGTALEYLNDLGLKNIAAYEKELLAYVTLQLQSIPKIRIIGTADNKSSVVSFVVEGIHPLDIGSIIDKLGIAIRTGQHCTQPLMECFNITGTARVSFAFYNTIEEIDVFIIALKRAINMLE